MGACYALRPADENTTFEHAKGGWLQTDPRLSEPCVRQRQETCKASGDHESFRALAAGVAAEKLWSSKAGGWPRLRQVMRARMPIQEFLLPS